MASIDGGGLRYNEGKTRLELVSPELDAAAARVLAYGAQKYAPWNWARGMTYSSVYGCLQRHLAAWYAGEEKDPESGLSHLDHVVANVMFLAHFAKYYPQGDDRPKEYFKQDTSETQAPTEQEHRCSDSSVQIASNVYAWCGHLYKIRAGLDIPMQLGPCKGECNETTRD